MIPWWWLIGALLAGVVIGIMVVGIFGAASQRDDYRRAYGEESRS